MTKVLFACSLKALLLWRLDVSRWRIFRKDVDRKTWWSRRVVPLKERTLGALHLSICTVCRKEDGESGPRLRIRPLATQLIIVHQTTVFYPLQQSTPALQWLDSSLNGLASIASPHNPQLYSDSPLHDRLHRRHFYLRFRPPDDLRTTQHEINRVADHIFDDSNNLLVHVSRMLALATLSQYTRN